MCEVLACEGESRKSLGVHFPIGDNLGLSSSPACHQDTFYHGPKDPKARVQGVIDRFAVVLPRT